jgi:hypothetical protein
MPPALFTSLVLLIATAKKEKRRRRSLTLEELALVAGT